MRRLAGKQRCNAPKELDNHLYHILDVVNTNCQQSSKVEQNIKKLIGLRHSKEMLQER